MVPPFLLQVNNLRPREGRQLAQGHTSDSRAGPEPELKLEPTTEAMKSLPAHVAHGKLRLRTLHGALLVPTSHPETAWPFQGHARESTHCLFYWCSQKTPSCPLPTNLPRGCCYPDLTP